MIVVGSMHAINALGKGPQPSQYPRDMISEPSLSLAASVAPEMCIALRSFWGSELNIYQLDLVSIYVQGQCVRLRAPDNAELAASSAK